MKPRLSKWLSIGRDGNPALPGWYECRYWPGDTETRMRRWDGKAWRLEAGPMAAFGLVRHHGWRGLAEDPSAAKAASQDTKPLTRCAAGRDGECGHAQCPQLRDNEPHATGRHCPLDNHTEE